MYCDMAIPPWDGDYTEIAAFLGGKSLAMQKNNGPNDNVNYWLTYQEAADYLRLSVAYLRNLVSAGQIPVYGTPRRRRFRRDMLDAYIADRDAAMRKFLLEQRRTHVR
jgi:excisionase family DNA binding protein